MSTETKSDIIAELKAIEDQEKKEIESVRLKYSFLFHKKYEELKGEKVCITRYSWRGNEKNIAGEREGTVIDVGPAMKTGHFSGLFEIRFKDYYEEENIQKNARPVTIVDTGDKIEIL